MMAAERYQLPSFLSSTGWPDATKIRTGMAFTESRLMALAANFPRWRLFSSQTTAIHRHE